MPPFGKRASLNSSVDLGAVRDTLHYIESDLSGPTYAQLRAIVGLALAEVSRIECTEGKSERQPLQTVRFVPAES